MSYIKIIEYHISRCSLLCELNNEILRRIKGEKNIKCEKEAGRTAMTRSFPLAEYYECYACVYV